MGKSSIHRIRLEISTWWQILESKHLNHMCFVLNAGTIFSLNPSHIILQICTQLTTASRFAMEVCFLASGEKLTVLAPDEFEGKSAKAVKQVLAAKIDVTIFRQRLFSEDGSEIPDDEIFASAPGKLIMIVILDFSTLMLSKPNAWSLHPWTMMWLNLRVCWKSLWIQMWEAKVAWHRCTVPQKEDMSKACSCWLKQVLKKMHKTKDLTGWRHCMWQLQTGNLTLCVTWRRLVLTRISKQSMAQRHCWLQLVKVILRSFVIWWKLVPTKIKPRTMA